MNGRRLDDLGQDQCTSSFSSEPTMTPTHIKTVIRRFYDEIWNNHDKAKIPDLLRSDFTFRGSLGQKKKGHDEFASYVDFVHEALMEYRCDLLDLVVEGNQAFARMRFSGLHRGEFFGFKPTGKQVEWAGAALFTFQGNQVADLWVLGDLHGLLQVLEQNTQ
jgi:predicted ester cyclase